MGATGDVPGQLAALLASPGEAGPAAAALSGQSPEAARGLVRVQLGRMADRTVNNPTDRGLPREYGGAQFASDLRSPGEGAATRAALEAVDRQAAERFDRLAQALAATGWRENVGSRTAFNAKEIGEMKHGRIGRALEFAAGPMKTAREEVQKRMLGRSAEGLADLLTQPGGLDRLQELAGSPSQAAIIAALLARHGYAETQRPARAR
jgi:hypothetical protein